MELSCTCGSTKPVKAKLSYSKVSAKKQNTSVGSLILWERKNQILWERRPEKRPFPQVSDATWFWLFSFQGVVCVFEDVPAGRLVCVDDFWSMCCMPADVKKSDRILFWNICHSRVLSLSVFFSLLSDILSPRSRCKHRLCHRTLLWKFILQLKKCPAQRPL